MPFDTGRVTFTRFHVTGDAPTHVDDAFLSILSEARFRESELGAPEEVEAGFTTGLHLFDTQFTYEKNGFGTPGSGRALFALRLDTHKVPADVKKAYRVMNEQAAAAGNPTGFASKSEKREARETANEQVRQELASGKYRKSKVVPILWDFGRQTLYCGAAGTTVIEHLSRLMRQAFAVEFDNLSAGVLAGNLIKAQGRSRDYEDLQPSAFTPPPDVPRVDEDGPAFGDGSLPVLPWIAKSVDLKDYLGNEFLMWLWWHGERDRESPAIKTETAGDVFVALDKALDMDCAWDLTGKQTLRGDHPTRLPEAGDALTTGKWPRKTGLILADAEYQWELTLQGDQFVVGGASLPEIEAGDAATPRELLERRLDLIVVLSDTLNALFTAFLERRASGPWQNDRDAIKVWIKQRQEKDTARPAPASSIPDMEPAGA
ncbi:MAG: hypothetical protein AAF333_18430 [Planctomycetota bacterium]